MRLAGIREDDIAETHRLSEANRREVRRILDQAAQRLLDEGWTQEQLDAAREEG